MFRKAYNESWPWDHPLKMLIQAYYFIQSQICELFRSLLRKYQCKNSIFNKYHSQLLNYWIRSLSRRFYIKKVKYRKIWSRVHHQIMAFFSYLGEAWTWAYSLWRSSIFLLLNALVLEKKLNQETPNYHPLTFDIW